MTDRASVSPGEALSRLFDVIREEALANPNFARRLLLAAGVEVRFVGGEALATVDPVLLAAKTDSAGFYETFATFSDKDLTTLIKSFNLATDEDMKALKKAKGKKPDYIALMWKGAQSKLADRGVR